MEINRIQLIILSILQKMQATSPISSIGMTEIQNAIPIKKSYSSIYRYIVYLSNKALVAYGVKDGKFKTFYITEKGINILKELSL